MTRRAELRFTRCLHRRRGGKTPRPLARWLLRLFLFSLPLLAGTSVAYAATDIQFSADQLSTSLAQGKEHTILSGHAHVHTKNTDITASRIELYGSNFRYALCTGNVVVDDSEREIHLTGDSFFYDRETEVARMEGNAVMEDRKNSVVVKAGLIENRNQDNLAVMQIGVRIFQKDMVARAEFARYQRDKQLLELSGLPVAYYKGDEYRAAKINVNLDTDDISLEGEVRGTITTENQQNGSSSGNGADAGSTSGTSSGANPPSRVPPPSGAGGSQ